MQRVFDRPSVRILAALTKVHEDSSAAQPGADAGGLGCSNPVMPSDARPLGMRAEVTGKDAANETNSCSLGFTAAERLLDADVRRILCGGGRLD